MEQQKLFKKAREIRKQNNIKAIIRGVIEISSHCRKQCKYCPMSNMNKNFSRFRLKAEQIIEIAKIIRKEDIEILFLQSGEDILVPELLIPILPKIKELGFTEIIGNFGDLNKNDLSLLKNNGLDGYISKFETSNEKIHKGARGYQLAKRIYFINSLFSLQFRVGVGSIVGLPNQRIEDMAQDIILTNNLTPQMASVTPFIPAKNTPYANNKPGDINYVLNTIAILRIMNPRISIPAVSALEKLRPGGQFKGLLAGANTSTVNFTPKANRDN